MCLPRVSGALWTILRAMTTVPQRGPLVSLVLTCHPLPTAAMTLGLTLAAALSGRSAGQCALVAATVLTGQLSVGWLNDLVDAERDRRTGRRDKPVAQGLVGTRTVTVAAAVAMLLVVPLSLANGTLSGLAHLAAVASAWTYDLYFKRTALSWLPYAVSFGLLPAFLSYGGLGLGAHGGPPTVAMTVLAALLGVGIHFLNALPDAAQDEATGVRHLPLLVARRTGAPRLLRLSLTVTGLVVLGMAFAALTVGLRR